MCKKMMYLTSFVLVLGLAVPSVVEAADPDLVGLWRLDETSGATATDSSGLGNDGTVEGGAVWVAGGKLAGALWFNGNDSQVRCPHIPFDNRNFTVTLWCNIDTLGAGDQNVFSQNGGEPGKRMHFRILGDGSIRMGYWGPSPADLNSTPVLEVGKWVHLAFVQSVFSDARRIHVDGVEIASDSGVAFLGTTGDTLIGSQFGEDQYFLGLIDDVRIYSRALSADEILESMIEIPKETAEGPVPTDGATDVPRDVVLSWAQGLYADKHDVYFGTNFDDVNNASRISPRGVLLSQSRDPNSYNLAEVLEFGQTYYWRIDEVNAPPDSTIFRGDVWSFTTEPIAYPVPSERITATASSSAPDQRPENTVNASGLDADDLHSMEGTDMWLTAVGAPGPAWIQYEFDKVLKLYEMWVWNQNTLMESAIGFGIKDAIVEYSVDGATWTTLGTTHEFARAPGVAGYAANTTIDFAGAAAKYVKLTPNSNWGGILDQYGLSEVRFLSVPVHAIEPDPASGATDVSVEATLSWRAGREADKHDVYLSTDEQAVIDGTGPVQTVTEPSCVSSLDLASTYYWRVDEVNDAETTTMWQGEIWSFSTQESLVVEDFESYNDISEGEEGSNLVYYTWIDGFENPSGNGSTMGYTEPFQPSMETSIVIEGVQSAPLFYDNTVAPYSEVTANIGDLQIGPDWTKGGPETLVLWIRGNGSNAATDQLYVKINNAKVVYDGDLSEPIWKNWNVDLTSLGTDLSNVTTLSIGVDGNGSGMLLVDNIALYRIAPPMIERGPDPSLVGHWKLDETSGLTAIDSSGYGNHGTLRNNDGTLMTMTGTEWTAGIKDGALFLENGQYVDFGNDPSLQLSRDATISAWVKMEPANADAYMGIGGKLVSGPYNGFALVRHSSNVFRLWVCNPDGSNLTAASSDVTYNDTDWHHVVGVVSNNSSSLYVDGVKQAEEAAVNLVDTGDYAYIGKQYSNGTDRYWVGAIDDVRIYYRALSAAEILGL